MRSIVVLLLLILVGCSSEVADAEQELAIVSNSGGSNDEICAARRKVADAYLKEQNAVQYRQKRLEADIACERAASDRMVPSKTSDDMVPDLNALNSD